MSTETSTPSPTNHLKPFLAGALSGLASSIITTPLDLLKTKLQSTHPLTFPPSPFLYLHSFLISSLAYIPTYTLYFYTYSLLSLSGYSYVFSAMSAGLISTLSTQPLWVLKTRVMVFDQTIPFAFNQCWSDKRLFYRGIGPSCVGVVHVGIQFGLWEKYKQWNQFSFNGGDAGDIKNVIVGVTGSKVVASLVTYPHEVVRTRLQTGDVGVGVVLRRLWLEGGWYRGFVPNLCRVVPSSVVTIGVYEWCMRVL